MLVLYRIVAPHFVAGLEADTHVKQVAPILKYMTGWRLDKVWTYVISKGWDIHCVSN